MTGTAFQKLQQTYPRRANELREHLSDLNSSPAEIESAAARVWRLSQLYLVFLDGEDHDFPKDPDIDRTMRELANKRPICPVDEEAWAWMRGAVLDMPHFEIVLSVMCAVDVVGTLHVLNGAADDNINGLVAARNRGDPRMRGK